jgi:peptide/nickel transport system permease protein
MSGRAASRRATGGGARRARLATLGVGALVACALVGPYLTPWEPNRMELERRLEGPSWSHPLGLDELGRDVASRLLAGARVSVAVGLAVVGVAGTLGTLLGAAAGAAGGRWDAALVRAIDVFLAFPGILLAIALVAVLGPALTHVVVALAAIGWVGYARLARGQVLQLKEQEFVLAARAAGVPPARLVFRHLLPNVLPLVIVQASLGLAGAMLAEASLSFLGLGIQPPTPSWGAMIDAGRSHLLDAPHVTLFPGIAIALSVLSLNFLGDALIDRLDPRRRAGTTGPRPL